MAEKSGFFNSVNGDRKYKADFFAEYFASFIGNGIFPNPSTSLQAISNSNMTVTINSGKAWINGYYYFNDSNLVLTIDTADGVLNRIDKIVLQFDTLNRTINLRVKKGSCATNPTAPVLQRDANAYELGLADIYIGKGVLSITQANITDLRLDTTKCGIVHGTVEQVDTTTLFNQYQTWIDEKKSQYNADITSWTAQKQAEYEAWFDTTTAADESEFDIWFDGVKGIFEGDAIGNLTNKVNSIPIFQTAQGTVNAIVLTNFDLIDGNSKTFIVAYNNNGAATTINGKNLYKPNTTNSPTLIAGKAVTIWYSTANDCFFIKASAEGNTIAAHVLAGDTFSNDVDTGLVGTMPNNGELNKSLAINGTYAIPAGYTSGGTVTQSIPTKGAATITPSTVNQTISSGQYLSGTQTINPVTGTANTAQVLSGYTFASANGIGLTGAMTNRANTKFQICGYEGITEIIPHPSDPNNQGLITGKNLYGATGYIDGNSQIQMSVNNLVPSNIVEGVAIGLHNGTGSQVMVGTATIASLGGKNYVSGSTVMDFSATGVYLTINTGWTPSLVSYKAVYVANPSYVYYGYRSNYNGEYYNSGSSSFNTAINSTNVQLTIYSGITKGQYTVYYECVG